MGSRKSKGDVCIVHGVVYPCEKCRTMGEELARSLPVISKATHQVVTDERDALRARVAELEIALSTLLDAAERQTAGFPLEAEQWFAVRDYARARLPEKGKEEVARG